MVFPNELGMEVGGQYDSSLLALLFSLLQHFTMKKVMTLIQDLSQGERKHL